jgi:ABC-type nitrate/sulfonate/bicarbonate transport system substrate-binding protein
VAENQVGALQIGRRAMIVCAAIIVPPHSDVYTPYELAGKPVAIDHGNGTAYAALQMLEGAMPRDRIVTVAAEISPAVRFAQLLRGDFAATVVQEPYITVAEKAGCRIISTTFFHGTWVAAPGLSAETYAAFLRGIKRAVRRINADKRRYVAYYLQDHPDQPEVQALRPEDFNLDRVRLMEPAPIPEEQARWAWEWMSSWGILHGDFDVASQIDRALERRAHQLAAVTQGAG